MNEILEEIYEKYKNVEDRGEVATYIPELANMDKKKLAIGIIDKDGNINIIGDVDTGFTIQSMSKPIVLALALKEKGDFVWQKVDKSPTTDRFNQFYNIDLLDAKLPKNPMINLGAISTTGLIDSIDGNRFDIILNFIKEISDNPSIKLNEKVYKSESKSGYRNRSMAYLLKEIGNIESPEEVIEDYFKQCSIEINIVDLLKISYLFLTKGKDFKNKEQLIPKKYISTINSIMATSGMYNYSGEFLSQVGIPAKSGVSGGIFAIAPEKYGIAVFSPGLDKNGNSKLGIEILKELSTKLDLHIF